MKVISLLQPWATLVVIGAKKIETRSWNTKFRGEILIHASSGRSGLKMLDKEPWSDLNKLMTCYGIDEGYEFPLGCIIGKANVECTEASSMIKSILQKEQENWMLHPNRIFMNKYLGLDVKCGYELAFGDYSPGRYGWLLSNPVSFDNHHYPVKGNRGLWNFDPEICLQCGCTGEDACVHPDFGACWWVEPYLCSHCTEIG